MSKLTTKGNRRIAAKIEVMTTNERTIGATKATPAAAAGLKGKERPNKTKPVAGRNIGRKTKKKVKAKK